MAITYTYGDMINTISRGIPRATEEDFAALICNATMEEIWSKYNWRESVKELPAFWLAPGTQDYGAPMVTIPSDFGGLLTAYIVNFTDGEPYIFKMETSKWLDRTSIRGIPRDIGYYPETNSFRVNPVPDGGTGVPNWVVNGTYKTNAPKVTPATYSGTLLPFDDSEFFHLMEVFKWKGMELAGMNAGEIVRSGAGIQASGQAAKAIAAVEEMAANQGLLDGDTHIHPSGPLVSNYGPGWTSWIG